MRPEKLHKMFLIRKCLFVVLAAVLCSTLAGCGSQTDGRLVGKWQVAKPDSINRKVSGATSGETPKMVVEFFSSGKLVTTTQMGKIDSVKTGTWEKVSSPEEDGPIQIQCQIGIQTTTHEIEYQTDSIRWIPPNLAGTTQKVLFVRLKN